MTTRVQFRGRQVSVLRESRQSYLANLKSLLLLPSMNLVMPGASDSLYHPDAVEDAVLYHRQVGIQTFQALECWLLMAHSWVPPSPSPCAQGYASSLGAAHSQCLVGVGCRGLILLPQFGTVLQGHPSSRTPPGASRGLHHNCIAVYLLSTPSPSSLGSL